MVYGIDRSFVRIDGIVNRYAWNCCAAILIILPILLLLITIDILMCIARLWPELGYIYLPFIVYKYELHNYIMELQQLYKEPDIVSV